MRRKQITVIGSGNTGSETAMLLAAKGLGDIVLVSDPDHVNQAKGKALDVLQATAIFGSDVQIQATASYETTAGSDLVIITAGAARRPGMSRGDLTQTNLQIVSSVVEQAVKFSPNCIFLVLTNPVDVMTYVVYQVSGFTKNRIIGQSGVLDGARCCTFIAEELGVSARDVTTYVLGAHGDDMVPLPRYSFVSGLPVTELLNRERMDHIIQRTRQGGAEIVNLLGNGSAYYAPASSLVQMAESILLDQRRVITGVAYLEGEYGYDDIVLGVPVVLGANGIERIIELELLPEEKKALDRSAEAVRRELRDRLGLRTHARGAEWGRVVCQA